MAVRTGEQFLEGLRDGREVWLEGERVEDVTAHPKLTRMAHTLAGIYDLQHSPELHDRMTFNSPTSGEPVALSYLVPETHDDLLRRRGALEIAAEILPRDAGAGSGLCQYPAHGLASIGVLVWREGAQIRRQPAGIPRVCPGNRICA